jgi:DNA-binding SARP family transcriptional activator/predicted ATPase
MLIGVRLFGLFEVDVGAGGKASEAEAEPGSAPQRVLSRHWRAKHARWLLQLIALQSGGQMHRDQVLDRLWPESDGEAAANRLYHTLHALRKLFEPYGIDPEQPVLQLQAGVVRLNPSHQIVIDACEFQALVVQARANRDETAQAAQLEQAIALYSGDLLVNEPFEDWVARARAGYKRDYLWALDRLASLYSAQARIDEAIELYKKLVDTEPTDEGAHRALMRLFEAAGHPERAMLQYIACKRYLERDLDVPPSSETEALADAINDREKQKRAQAQKDKAMATQDKPRYSAPAHAISLLGRDGDLATLQRWLEDDSVRLISIVGSAGLGKTRLVHALAERAQDRFKDGVIAVALTTLTEPEQLIGQLAVALGVTAQGETELVAVSKYLASRQLLLVLDRFEHILPAAQQLSALLMAAPHIKILATTQALLRIPAERIYELPSLLHSGADAAAASALFRAVAANLNVHFEGDPHVALIGQICEKLGGNALAIELAAAQTQLLTLPEILKGLELPLALLTNPTLDVEQQHRSLHGAIEWSHRLLDEDTKRIFAMLGVFASAFTLDDAAEVLKDFCSKTELSRALQTLLDRHLIARSEHSTPCADGPTSLTLRLSFLDTVKQFAHQQLASSKTVNEVEEAHAHYFTELCGRLIDNLRRGTRVRESVATFSVLEKEALKALYSHQARPDTLAHLRMSYFLSWLMFSSGQFENARLCASYAISATKPKSVNERAFLGWCHYTIARCDSFEGKRIAVHNKLIEVLRLTANGEDEFLFERVTIFIAAASLHEFQTARARQSLKKLLNRDKRALAKESLPVIYMFLANVDSLDGSYSAAVSHAALGFELAVKTDNEAIALTLLLTQVDNLVSLGALAQAVVLLKDATFNYDALHAPINRLNFRFTEVLLAIERLDIETASRVLSLILEDGLTSTIDSLRTRSQVLTEVLTFEQQQDAPKRSGAGVELRAISDADSAHLFALHCVYAVKKASASKNWHNVCSGLNQSILFLRKTKNALWYSWLFDACSFALLAKGEWGSAGSLLDYSKQLIETVGIKATPRQLRDWDRIAEAIQSQRQNTAPQGVSCAPKNWFGASPETLKQLQTTMQSALLPGCSAALGQRSNRRLATEKST